MRLPSRFAGRGCDSRIASRHRRRHLPRKAIASLAAVVLLAGWLLHKLPVEVVFVYVVMSGIAIFMYAFDKSAAQRGRQRTPRTRCTPFAPRLGGWPGALLAQDMFRHKSSKAEFQAVFWTTVVVNCGALVWLLRSWPLR